MNDGSRAKQPIARGDVTGSSQTEADIASPHQNPTLHSHTQTPKPAPPAPAAPWSHAGLLLTFSMLPCVAQAIRSRVRAGWLTPSTP